MAATAEATNRAANDVSLREMRNDARLRRMMRCLWQHLGRKPSVFDFIGLGRPINRSLAATAAATNRAANDVSLREMMNDARLRRMMRCLRQHSGRKPSVFDFIVFRQTDKSEFAGAARRRKIGWR